MYNVERKTLSESQNTQQSAPPPPLPLHCHAPLTSIRAQEISGKYDQILSINVIYMNTCMLNNFQNTSKVV